MSKAALSRLGGRLIAALAAVAPLPTPLPRERFQPVSELLEPAEVERLAAAITRLRLVGEAIAPVGPPKPD